ncbi:MAG: flavodoxin domain-containing protein [Candidatus Dormibacteria bacterium]
MTTLVGYASRYGATRGIAERIADTLASLGHPAQARPVHAVGDLARYDAFVIGSAAYMGSWLREAREFVRINQKMLTTRPVWLFSSGPLGAATTDAKGRDVLVTSEPKEFAEFREAVSPRATRVFFGALNPGKLSFSHRAARLIPAARVLMPEGDFRNWADIDAWATSIASELAGVLEPALAGVGR